MNNSLEEIGKRLSERRRKVGLSQEELGERAGVTGQTISYAELGKKAMRTDTYSEFVRCWRLVQTICCWGRSVQNMLLIF